MTSNDYQILASRTLLDVPDRDYSHEEIMLVWNAIGLAGEAGEVADHIKKGVFHDHGIDNEKLVKELGDVLWYVAAIATKIGVPLALIMELNIAKLKQRYPDGFKTEDSISRVDVQ